MIRQVIPKKRVQAIYSSVKLPPVTEIVDGVMWVCYVKFQSNKPLDSDRILRFVPEDIANRDDPRESGGRGKKDLQGPSSENNRR